MHTRAYVSAFTRNIPPEEGCDWLDPSHAVPLSNCRFAKVGARRKTKNYIKKSEHPSQHVSDHIWNVRSARRHLSCHIYDILWLCRSKVNKIMVSGLVVGTRETLLEGTHYEATACEKIWTENKTKALPKHAWLVVMSHHQQKTHQLTIPHSRE